MGSPQVGMRKKFFNQGAVHRMAATNHGWPRFAIAIHQHAFAGQQGRAGGELR